MSNRAVRVAWPALTVLVATAALLLLLAAQGGDGQAAMRTGRPFARLVLGLAAAATLGLLATAAAERGGARRRRLLDAAAVTAALQTVATALAAFLLHLQDAPAVSSPGFGPGLVAFLLELPIGRAWLAAAAAAAVVSALAVAARTRTGAAVALVVAVVALVPLATQAAAPGDPLAAARTAVVAGGLREVGVALALGALLVHASASGEGRRDRRGATAIGVAGAVVALVGSASTALLRGGAVTLLDTVVLLVAAAVAAAAVERDRPVRRAAVAARIELVVLAVAAGIGAAPALTDPVHAEVAARTTPAEILTGEALPGPLGAGTLLTLWRVDPLLLLVCAGLAVLGVVGALRARASGEALQPLRVGSWTAGVLVLLLITCGGLAVYQPLLLGAYTAQHLALLLVVPLLLAGGAPTRMLERTAPSDALAARALRVLGSPAVARLTDPRWVGALVVLVVLVLGGTGALRWSIVDPVGAEAVDLLLLGVGALLVHAVLGRRSPRSPAVAVVTALLVLEVVLAGALLLGTGLLQADWFGAMGWGTDALAAQRGAAWVVLLVAVPPTVVLLVAARRRPRSPAAAGPVEPASALVLPGGADA